MKKRYTTKEYKKYQKRHREREERKKRRKNKVYSLSSIKTGKNRRKKTENIKQPISAPKDFRVLENTEECIGFLSHIRKKENVSNISDIKFVTISLKQVEEIDYSAVCILKAISNDLMIDGIILRGDLPTNQECKKQIRESGFLNNMQDEKGEKFPNAEESDTLFFEKGEKKLDVIKIGNVVKKINKHLTNEEDNIQFIYSILHEICGNTVDWSEARNKQYFVGVKYNDDKAILTVVDVGLGILGTLEKKKSFVRDLFLDYKKPLLDAFRSKGQSKSKKPNRNKGLPYIKKCFDDGQVKELKVLTNNVILHFDNENKSKELKTQFRGTFYRWIVTKESIQNKKTIQ